MIYLALILTGTLAWFISTLTAGGAAMLVIPVLGVMLGVELVAPVLSVATVMANPARALMFRKFIRMDVIRWLLPGSLIGAVAGSWLLSRSDPIWIQLILGIFLSSIFVQYRFGKSDRSFAVPAWWFLPLGIIVAGLSALTGATGPVLNPFLLNYGLIKENMVGTKSFNSLFMQLTKVGAYMSLGIMSQQAWLAGAALGTGAIIGAYLAKRQFVRISAAQFKMGVLIMMTISGVVMLIDALRRLL